MAKEALPCLVCGKRLENIDHDNVTNQPYQGTAFMTTGHYGSTAFDPQDDSYLEINICDECLVKKGEGTSVLWGRQHRHAKVIDDIRNVLDDFKERSGKKGDESQLRFWLNEIHASIYQHVPDALVPWKPKLDQPTETAKDGAAYDEAFIEDADE